MKVELPHKFFRPGTLVEPHIQGFVVAQGGLGDCIGLSTAIVYIAKHYKNVIGHVFTHDFFVPIMQNFLSDYPEWKVFELKELTQDFLNKYPVKYPTHDPIGRLGASAVDLGFIYYLNMITPKNENKYPKLKLDIDPSISWYSKHIVMTPISTNPMKRMGTLCFNRIKNYLIIKGYTPIFLRKSEYKSYYNFFCGLNFINYTDLISAAKLMAKSKLVIGIDNGLLHLAACTHPDIIWGFTVSSPQHTQPKTKSLARITPIFPDKRTLSCRFCQSNMRFFGNEGIHNFNDGCFYKEEIPECVSERHLGDPKRWIKAIERFL